MAARVYRFKIGTMPATSFQVRKQSMSQLRLGGRVFVREPSDGSKWQQVVIDKIDEDPAHDPHQNLYFAYKL